jgi:hypothetical protein
MGTTMVCDVDAMSRCLRGAPASCAPLPVVRPCGRCGHALDEHDEVFGGAGCMHHLRWPTIVPCACSQWVRQEPAAVASTLRTDSACQEDCLCGEHHPLGAVYYVTCRRDHLVTAVALLLGPFHSHAVALGLVDTARRAAERVDPRAVWYAYGTTALRGPASKPGKLNDLVLR